MVNKLHNLLRQNQKSLCVSHSMVARLPQDKLARTKQALYQWSLKKSAMLRELQSLIGTLQFACRVIAPGSPFVQRIIHQTKGTQLPYWQNKLIAGFWKDIKIWVDLLENWNGVSIFRYPHVSHPPDLQLFTDASGSIGYEGFLDGQWFQGHWLPEHTPNKKLGISIE